MEGTLASALQCSNKVSSPETKQGKMKPSSILRSLSSLRIAGRLLGSSAVAPLPLGSSFDQQVTAEQSQRAPESEYMTWLLHALDTSTTTQQITLDSLSDVVYQSSDRKAIDEYLDCNVNMLDACNELTEKIEIIQNYVESLRVVSHLLEGNVKPHPTTLARVGDMLDSCKALERRCNERDKCSLGLSKLFIQKLVHGKAADTKLEEILSGSVAVSSMVCLILGLALSFKSKRGLPTLQADQSVSSSWSCSLQELQQQVSERKKSSLGMMIIELQHIFMAARALRDQIKCKKQSELRVDVEKLKRSCGNLEDGIKKSEERVKELYKQLINVRMFLLGILSQI